ncbi:hypothetical protein F8G81_22320 [Arthrobacter sp. CDRTa11]|uniref:hypothetical protein n=1 Tax=Arthrobacter sp. CDRTa11 TaxID=2651199 RepID=UPI002265CCFF|nr:hypothetical protein [Arthrobacter sp. CDRTa11]UZX05023.1 hypothetical protein F8G81_22320 [Arthrobacter sp. CDRTa11]
MGDATTIALNLTFFGTLGLAFLMFFILFLLVVATLVLAGIGRLAALLVMALFGRFPRNDPASLVHFPAPKAQTAGTARAAEEPGPAVPDQSVPVSGSFSESRGIPESDDAAAASSPASKAPAGGVLRVLRSRVARPASAPTAPRDWGALLKPAELRSRFRTAVEHHPLLTAARSEPPVLAKDWAAAVAEADARAIARARAAAPEIKLSVRELPSPAVPAEKVEAVAPLVESALHQDKPVHDVPRSFKKPPAAAPLSMLDTGSLVSLSGHAKVLKGKLPADRH